MSDKLKIKDNEIEIIHGEEEAGTQDKEMTALYEQTMKEITPGQIIKGVIIDVVKNEVVIDVGFKSEGIVSLKEFDNPEDAKIGEEINVYVENLEDNDGMLVLSKTKAEKTQGWEMVITRYREGDIVEGKVLKKVKGGLMIDIGVDAFLPASLVFTKGFGNVDQLLDQTIRVQIVKINRSRKNIVVSRKDVLAQEMEETRKNMLKQIQVGHILPGVVKNITDFGVFIDLGGVDGLLHITDMSWGRISHPSEMVAIGDNIEVMILNIDEKTKKISLGLKQKTENPWKEAAEKYPIGSKVKGKVVNIVPYGAFIELEKGVEGLVHVSELSWTKRITNTKDVLAMGDVIEAVVLNVEADKQKISLGIKQMEENPWLKIGEKYSEGDKIKGKVTALVDYGAFVEIEAGIEGLIHVKDMSWTKRINHPSEILKKGQKVEVLVLSVDGENKKLSLGLKQLEEDPWNKISEKYLTGVIIEGPITKITPFGIFIELEEGIEGLVHISEIDGKTTELEQRFNVGDKIEARVISVDNEARKIALSMKEIG